MCIVESVDAGRGKRWRISIYLIQVRTSQGQVEADGLKPRFPIRTSMSMNGMKADSARSMSPPFDNSCRLGSLMHSWRLKVAFFPRFYLRLQDAQLTQCSVGHQTTAH